MGLINAVNTLPDQSAPDVYRTEVLRKYETHGRFPSSNLVLDEWGPLEDSDDVSVPRAIYEHVKVGDRICIGLHPGFLRVAWYTLIPCSDGSVYR